MVWQLSMQGYGILPLQCLEKGVDTALLGNLLPAVRDETVVGRDIFKRIVSCSGSGDNYLFSD